MRTTVQTEPITIRPLAAGDGDMLKRLTAFAVGDIPPPLREMYAMTDRGEVQPTIREVPFERKSTRENGVLPVFHRTVVAERRGKVVGMSHVGNPISWMHDLRHIPSTDMLPMVSRVNEIQVIAVEPRVRGKGIGTQLLTEVLDAFRATGHRAALVVIQDDGRYQRLRAWYEEHGFVFDTRRTPAKDDNDEPLHFWQMRPRADDDPVRFRRGDFASHCIGIASLDERLTITPADGDTTPCLTGLLDQDDRR
jgi:ribosomal protein S18 acetylase RimI-like enzyme